MEKSNTAFPRFYGILIKSGIGLALLLIVYFVIVKVEFVPGNKLGVRESWFGGVDPTPLAPGIHFFFPGFMNKVSQYEMSSHVYVMNDRPMEEEFGTGREKDSYTVQSAEGQSMKISLQVRWRPDPIAIVNIHKTIRDHLEEKILRPVLLRVVKDQATTKKAIEAYSGAGLVSLQQGIEHVLTDPKEEMRSQGIIVENFVIEEIELDPAYIAEIKSRQVAVQRKLRADQEQIAAMAEAERAKAEAQSDYNKQIVAANRDKEKIVIEAEAAKAKQVLTAEAEKESSVLRAQAIQALVDCSPGINPGDSQNCLNS